MAVAPAGTADLSKCPDRTDYEAGEAGEGDYEEDMRAFEAGSIGEKVVETRTLDMK